jgi:hypothetical protein
VSSFVVDTLCPSVFRLADALRGFVLLFSRPTGEMTTHITTESADANREARMKVLQDQLDRIKGTIDAYHAQYATNTTQAAAVPTVESERLLLTKVTNMLMAAVHEATESTTLAHLTDVE